MPIKDPELLTEADFPIEFGRYMLTGLLGEGGMGRVFTATLRGGGGFEKQVAVKVVRSSALRQNGGLAEGLENEARIGALLTHPNIVATNDFDIVHGHPMIAMELMRGLSLDAVLASGAQLEAAHILDIGRQVAEGLSAAHEFEDGAEGVSLVHRDLKPSNVFVTRNGIAKVLDLGIAKASEGFSNHTQTGLAKGSFGYMSPEQSAGSALDGRSDIFSLGAVLFEMATGETCFQGKNQREVLTALWNIEARLSDPAFARRVDDQVAGLGAVVHRCLRDKPQDRYAEAGDLADVLGRLSRRTEPEHRLSQTIRGAMKGAGALATAAPSPIAAADLAAGGTRVVQGQSGGGGEGTRVVKGSESPAPSTRVVEIDPRALAEKAAAEKAAAAKAAAAKAAAEKAAAQRAEVRKAAAEKAKAAQRVEARKAAAEKAAAEKAAAQRLAADRAEVVSRARDRAERLAVEKAAAALQSVVEDMVRIEPGTFTMGSPKGGFFGGGGEIGRSSDEVQHEVTLTHGFLLQRTPVTQAQYQALMGINPSDFTGDDQRPVESVSWFDAIKFANALSRKHGLKPCYAEDGTVLGGGSIYECEGYRLPTEAEWEYAARAGTIGARYGELEDIAWYRANSGEKTHPVGKKKPNSFGLYDMLGNAWEWCHDWYDDYPKGLQSNPQGSRAGSYRVLRGGSWSSGVAGFVRAALRFYDFPSFAYDFTGFRLARSAP